MRYFNLLGCGALIRQEVTNTGIKCGPGARPAGSLLQPELALGTLGHLFPVCPHNTHWGTLAAAFTPR